MRKKARPASMLATDKIKALRLSAGMSLAEAGGRLGGGASRWLDIESGRRPNVTLSTLDAMATALGVSPATLLESK